MRSRRSFAVLLLLPLASIPLAAQSALWTFRGAPGDYFGRSAGGAGDVDGDGVPDVIVSLRGAGPNGPYSGRAQVLSGRTGTVLHTFDGMGREDLGASVSGAGDVDGDGFADVIVGSPHAAVGGYEAGRAQVFSGRTGARLYAFDGSIRDRLGMSVGQAGDVDRDGYSDVIVGAPFAMGETGYARVFSGRTGAALLRFTGAAAGDRFGMSLGAADVDGDGYGDLIVGAYGASTVNGQESGRVQVFSGRTGGVLHTFDGPRALGWFGASVSGLGDVDGDGFDDLIVGEPRSLSSDGLGLGRAWVFSGRTGTVLHSLDSSAGLRFFGGAVGSAGDVDADGFDDLIVGASMSDTHVAFSGKARVFSGRTGAILHTFDGDSTYAYLGRLVCAAGDVNGDGFADVVVGATDTVKVLSGYSTLDLRTFDGGAALDRFGFSARSAGDVDGDGLADLIVGAPDSNANGTRSGRVRVLSGGSGGVLHTFDGAAGDRLGVSVAGAGDVDGDGRADLIAGASGAIPNGTSSGRARVFSGRTGAVLHTFDGSAARDYFGTSVDGAGDVDGDGFDDVIVGAPDHDAGGVDAGRAQVFSGRTGADLHTFDGAAAGDRFGFAVGGAGDVDGDGFADVIVGAHLHDGNGVDAGRARVFSGRTGAVLHAFDGDAAGDQLGFAVGAAGDVDGDGYADVIVGARLHDGNGVDAGRARVFSGRNGAALHTFDGDAAGDQLGSAVGGAGDVDGDGVWDLIVGAPGADVEGLDAGGARLFSGRTGAALSTFYGETPFDSFGYSVDVAGDIDGDGFADPVVGAPRSDNNGFDSGSVRVFSGLTTTDPRPGLFAIYGHGCPGFGGRLPHIGSRGRPAIGQTAILTLRTASASSGALLVVGLTRQQIDLGPFGAPGCRLWTSPVVTAGTTTDLSRRASIALPVPNSPGLVGLELYAQWTVLAQVNRVGVITSDAAMLRLGRH